MEVSMPLNQDNMYINAVMRKGARLFQDHDWKFEGGRKTNTPQVRMSNSGDCGRLLWKIFHEKDEFTELEGKNPRSPEVYTALSLGDILEEYVVRVLELGGIIVYSRQQELHDDITNVKGHIDGILHFNNENFLLEIKALKHDTILEYIQEGISHRYQSQMQFYMGLLELPATYFIALDKGTMQFFIQKVTYDQDFFERIQQKLLAVKHVPEMRKLPERFVRREACIFCPLMVECREIDGIDFEKLMKRK